MQTHRNKDEKKMANLVTACAIALSAVACQNDGVRSSAEGETEPASQVSQAVSAPSPDTEVVVQTSDGEEVRRLLPDMTPTVEVGPGGPCGLKGAAGAILSCEPGLLCIARAAGEPGICQPGPRAQPSEG
jgi:hypothetical protein